MRNSTELEYSTTITKAIEMESVDEKAELLFQLFCLQIVPNGKQNFPKKFGKKLLHQLLSIMSSVMKVLMKNILLLIQMTNLSSIGNLLLFKLLKL